MNYYERHIGDYAKDAGHLSMLEHGAYTLLLDRYYYKEQGIPVDQCYRVAKARSKEEKAAVDTVLAEFFRLTDGVWVKNRVQEEIVAARVRIEAARTNGKSGGRPRKNPAGKPNLTQKEPTGFPLGNPDETQDLTQPKALQSPVSSLQSPEDSRRGEEPPPVGTLKTQIYRLAKQIGIAPGVITREIEAHSEPDVWQALGATVAAKPADPLAYFRGCLKTKDESTRFKTA